MKKLLIALLAVGVLSFAVVGVASAQGPNPPYNGKGAGPMAATGETGPLHSYMVAALADALSLTADQVETRLEAGETAYDIAISQGTLPEDFPALMDGVRAKSVEAAVTAGVITQAQADQMLERGSGRGGMHQGMGAGQGPCDGTGVPVGTGLRRGGTR
ncbi:MAG: hypothetical protein ABIF04_04070 [Chloroflexota bacterium]